MLGSHPDIGTSQESHLFDHLISPAIKKWDLLMKNEVRKVGLPAYLTQEEFYDLMSDLSIKILGKSEEFVINKYFIEKTPDHLFSVDHILKLFPKTKIIVLIRNPYDVIESLLAASKTWGKHWAPPTVRKAAIHWNRYADSILNLQKTLPKETYKIMSYENLSKNPLLCLKKIISFLNIPTDEKVLIDMVNLYNNNLSIHGEFSKKLNSAEPSEPKDFIRKKKEKLSIFQRTLIYKYCNGYSKQLGL